MKATTILKAFGLGLLSEVAASAASVGMIALGGWGPCGPASYWSAGGAWLQFPGWYLQEEVLRLGVHPGVPGHDWGLPIIFTLQVLLWSGTWLCWFAWRARRKRSAEPVTSPNGGPATRFANSVPLEGPPSVK